jgi:hypothetical protein
MADGRWRYDTLGVDCLQEYLIGINVPDAPILFPFCLNPTAPAQFDCRIVLYSVNILSSPNSTQYLDVLGVPLYSVHVAMGMIRVT